MLVITTYKIEGITFLPGKYHFHTILLIASSRLLSGTTQMNLQQNQPTKNIHDHPEKRKTIKR
jgi:hypothetical protein